MDTRKRTELQLRGLLVTFRDALNSALRQPAPLRERAVADVMARSHSILAQVRSNAEAQGFHEYLRRIEDEIDGVQGRLTRAG